MKNPQIKKTINWILVFKIPIIIMVLLIFFFMGYRGQFIEYDSTSNIDNILKVDDPELLKYNQFEEDFGSNENIIISLETENIYTTEFMSFLIELTEKLLKIDGVKDVVSLSTINDITGTEDELIIEPFIQMDNFPMNKKDLIQLKESMINHPFLKKKIVNLSENAVVIYIRLKNEIINNEKKKEIIANSVRNITVKKIFQDQKTIPQRIVPHFVGDSIVSSEISIIQQNEDYIAIVMIIVLGLILLLVFRSFYGVVLPLMISITTICLIMGLKTIFHSSFSTIDSLLYALIFTISIGDSVHILSYWYSYEYQQIENKNERITRIIQHIFKPCFYTSITTAIGFGAIALSGIPQLRDFGIFAFISVIVAFILTMTFIPASLTIFNFNWLNKIENRKKVKRNNFSISLSNFNNRISKKISLVTINNSRIVVSCFIIILIVSIFGIFQIKIGTNPYSFLKDKTDVNIDLNFMENNFCGVQDLELILKGEQEDYFKNPVVLQKVEQLQQKITNLDSVTESNSIISFIKLLNKAMNNNQDSFYILPNKQEIISEYLFLYEISGDPDDLFDWVNFDYSKTRLNFKIINNSDLRDIREMIGSFFEDINLSCQYEITGSAMLWDKVDKFFLNSQIISLMFSIIFITLILFIIFRSLKLGMIAFVVNLFPLIVGFGILGFSGIGLNMGTVLIAPIAIGIAVDDTIHFITQYKNMIIIEPELKKRLEKVLIQVLKPIVLTSVILAIGFGSNSISNFKPNAYFGIVSAITLLVAMITDLFLLPTLLVITSSRLKETT